MYLRVGACVLAALLLAGCCSLPFSPEDVESDAPAEGGVGPRTITIEVLDPDEPADGVPLYVFWADPEEPGDLYLLGLRSAGGRVVAHVPADVAVHVVAGGGSHTIEWVLDLVGAGSGPEEQVVRVYPLKVRGEFSGTWSPAAVSLYRETGLNGVEWQLHDVSPGATDESRLGFAARLAHVSANLTWTNQLVTRADLGIGVMHINPDGVRCQFQDDDDEFDAEGPQSTRFESDQGAATECDAEEGSGLWIGPGTAHLALMPAGLDYLGNHTLTFGYPSDITDACERLAGDYTLHYLDPVTGGVERTARGGASYEPASGVAPVIGLAVLVGLAFVVSRRR